MDREQGQGQAEGAEEGEAGDSEHNESHVGTRGGGQAAEGANEGGEGGRDHKNGHDGKGGDDKAAAGSSVTGTPTKLPYGWLSRKLRADPSCLEYVVDR